MIKVKFDELNKKIGSLPMASAIMTVEELIEYGFIYKESTIEDLLLLLKDYENTEKQNYLQRKIEQGYGVLNEM